MRCKNGRKHLAGPEEDILGQVGSWLNDGHLGITARMAGLTWPGAAGFPCKAGLPGGAGRARSERHRSASEPGEGPDADIELNGRAAVAPEFCEAHARLAHSRWHVPRYRPEDVDGRVRYFPEEPIEDHYPAVVSKEDFRELEARRLAFRLPTILQGLARCPVCNRSMMVRRSAVPSQKYLLCLGWREARACSNRWVRYPEIEEIFRGDVQALVRRVPQPVMNHETRAAMLNSVSARLRTLRARRARELTARPIKSATMHIGALWSVRTDEEIEEQLAIRRRLRAGRNHWVDATLRLKLEELQ